MSWAAAFGGFTSTNLLEIIANLKTIRSWATGTSGRLLIQHTLYDCNYLRDLRQLSAPEAFVLNSLW
jgi:hypothetical protein